MAPYSSCANSRRGFCSRTTAERHYFSESQRELQHAGSEIDGFVSYSVGRRRSGFGAVVSKDSGRIARSLL
jgi:hypothetical protein